MNRYKVIIILFLLLMSMLYGCQLGSKTEDNMTNISQRWTENLRSIDGI